MNTDSRWRHDLARTIAERYAGRNRLRLILLGGSTAHGNADPWSDIDLVLYWERVDKSWLDSGPMQGDGIRRITWRETIPGELFLEQYMVGDLKVDLGHVALSWWDEVVSGVVDRYEVDD